MLLRSKSRVLALLILTAANVAGQGLAPEILLLSSIKRHVREDVGRLPDYTCLQTSERFNRPAGSKAVMKPLDTLRLEVLYTGKRELYAAPGDRDFREEHPGTFAAVGLSGSGLFATFLRTLFVSDSGMFTYRGEEQVGGRRAVRYDFRVPFLVSGWTIDVGSAIGRVGAKGAMWADPDSLDLLRLQIEAYDIPAELAVTSAIVNVGYGRMRIGDADVMLPQSGELEMVHTSGRESLNLLEYTHCRAFQAQSILSFGLLAPDVVPPGSPRPPRPAPKAELALPADLPITIRLASEIGANHGVGSAIEGIVSGNVTNKAKVLVPDGARVAGRLRRLEWQDEAGGFFLVGIEFTEIRFADTALRFYATLQGIEKHPSIDRVITEVTRRGNTASVNRIVAPDLPGVGVFFVRCSPIPAGLRMNWKTRALAGR